MPLGLSFPQPKHSFFWMVACLVLCPARCFVFAMGRVSRDSSTADFDGLFVYKRQFLSSGPACSAHLRSLALMRSLVLAILFFTSTFAFPQAAPPQVKAPAIVITPDSVTTETAADT